MASVNKVILVGNLGADPVLRFTPNGSPVTTISVATNFTYKDNNGGIQKGVDWHRVEVWGKQAEALAQYMAKGRQVYVEGRSKTDVVGEGENRKYFNKIVANQVLFLGNLNGGSEEIADITSETAEDSIPF